MTQQEKKNPLANELNMSEKMYKFSGKCLLNNGPLPLEILFKEFKYIFNTIFVGIES